MSGQLQRIVLTFKPEGLEARVLYRTKASPGPSTKVRRREVTELTRSGLLEALEALDGRVDVIGTSGFTTREDVLGLPATSSNTRKLVKGRAM